MSTPTNASLAKDFSVKFSSSTSTPTPPAHPKKGEGVDQFGRAYRLVQNAQGVFHRVPLKATDAGRHNYF
jgi:hypothetical protein